MKYKDLFKDKDMSGRTGEMISEAMDELAEDNVELKMKLAWILHKGHMCEYTATHKIKAMIPVACIGPDGNRMDGVKNMHDYLAAMGITPEIAHKHIKAAHERASMRAREKGFSAPSLDVNEWDCYWCIAMVMSDYWYTIGGNVEIASMLAYEYLSDPDRHG